MKYTTLPNTKIKISKICLGTMTWGEQNTESEGYQQMDYALDAGVNFFDTAELYPIPKNPKTQGATEIYIGNWFKKTGNRDKVVLASKVAGPPEFNPHEIREGGFGKCAIEDALNTSLKRLQTDYIDLYQLHWPDRPSNYFGKRGFQAKTDNQWEDNIRQTLESLKDFVDQGKIRHIGLSNDVPWSVMRFLEESKYQGLPRIATVQNPYNLLNRTYEAGLAEISLRENVGLLPYSPLAFGRLSDKFLNGQDISQSRINLYPEMRRYNKENALKATQRYYALAKDNNMSLATMSLAFLHQQDFVCSTIIGATQLGQLKENIASIDTVLDEGIINQINKIHESIPNPAP
ncbi:aldo/keto reductase [Galbibacter marinus]|uniref:Aldo/keto reductase n=1 Tax=Galbibacter marinus TaxID=555500 RepID=K2PTE1_9FLAO|nr:aldo/keto reductase [Galbibacter marinus]EKF54839.1 aldo/keto reductase [Galbibacter marinus]